jgi:hypothetical protein
LGANPTGSAARIEKILRKAGRSLDAEMAALEEPPELCEKEPGLAACYAAAAQGVTVSGDRAGLRRRAEAGGRGSSPAWCCFGPRQPWVVWVVV